MNFEIGGTGGVEGRTTVLSVIFLTLSIYVSSFSPVTSAIVVLLCVLRKADCLNALPLFLPFIGFFAVSSFLLGGPYHSGVMTLTTIALLLSGILVSSLPPSEFALSLSWIGVPESWAFQVALALRVFYVLKEDARHCFEAAKFEGKFPYLRAVKAFVSVSILRSVALAETLYCRSYSGKIPGVLKKPKVADYLFLVSSVLLLAFSIVWALNI